MRKLSREQRAILEALTRRQQDHQRRCTPIRYLVHDVILLNDAGEFDRNLQRPELRHWLHELKRDGLVEYVDPTGWRAVTVPRGNGQFAFKWKQK